MDQIAGEFTNFCKHLYDYWLRNNLWTWRWWVTVALTVLPWVFWIIVRKKESAGRLLCAGFLAAVVAIFLDIVGGGLELWAYSVRLIPVISCFLPWDICVLPVVTMLFLQFKPGINLFIKAAVYAFLGAFVCEPLAVWLDFAREPHWSVFYTFPILYGIYLLSYLIAARKSYGALTVKSE